MGCPRGRARRRHDRAERPRWVQLRRSRCPRPRTRARPRSRSSSSSPTSRPTRRYTFGHQFQIQEFRRPSSRSRDQRVPGPYYVAEPATVASMPSTSPVAHSPTPTSTGWSRATTTSYEPPNWDEYTFGSGRRGGSAIGYGDVASRLQRTRVLRSVLRLRPRLRASTVRGVHRANRSRRLPLPPDRLRRPRHAIPIPMPSPSRSTCRPSVTAEATVFDVNRQAWSLANRPARARSGVLRRSPERPCVREQGEPDRVERPLSTSTAAPCRPRRDRHGGPVGVGFEAANGSNRSPTS